MTPGHHGNMTRNLTELRNELATAVGAGKAFV